MGSIPTSDRVSFFFYVQLPCLKFLLVFILQFLINRQFSLFFPLKYEEGLQYYVFCSAY